MLIYIPMEIRTLHTQSIGITQPWSLQNTLSNLTHFPSRVTSLSFPRRYFQWMFTGVPPCTSVYRTHRYICIHVPVYRFELSGHKEGGLDPGMLCTDGCSGSFSFFFCQDKNKHVYLKELYRSNPRYLTLCNVLR